jgi:hypothetical protein
MASRFVFGVIELAELEIDDDGRPAARALDALRI